MAWAWLSCSLALCPLAQGLYMFATPSTYTASFGGLSVADTICSQLAAAATGKPFYNASFLSFLSAGSSAVSRFSSYPIYLANGNFVGKDLTTALTASLSMVDINGLANSGAYWTGTTTAGASSGSDCGGWTSTSILASGSTGSTGANWASTGSSACGILLSAAPQERLLCLQSDFPWTGQGGIHFFLSTTTSRGNLGGLAGADAICNSDAAGISALTGRSFRAFLSTTTGVASARIPPSRPLLALSGAVLASSVAAALGVNMLSLNKIPTGTASSSNTYWTGADTVNTCNDWTSSTGSGIIGDSTSSWFSSTPSLCSISRPLLCVEAHDPCVVNPCDDPSGCTDRGDFYGRTCTCPAGTIGSGELGQCVSLIPQAGTLIALEGSTLQQIDQILLNSTAGGQSFSFTVALNGTLKATSSAASTISLSSLILTPVGGGLQVQCTSLSPVSQSTPATNDGTVTLNCTLGPGAGVNLAAILSWCIFFPGNTPVYCTDTDLKLKFSYPAPKITPGTIRLSVSGQRSTTTTAITAGSTIVFEGTNFMPSIMQVFLGPTSNPMQYGCVLSALSTPTMVVCYPDSDGEGSNLVFTVVVAGRSFTGNDTFSYPVLPSIISVRGCPTVLGQATANCPTVGNVNLEIFGNAFGANISVLVDMKQCANPRGNLTYITCICPSGAGIDRSIIVNSGGTLTSPKPYISFAPPNVTSITAGGTCVSEGAMTIVGCDRYGGATLTLHGNNFGASGATVQIGIVPCRNVAQQGITQSLLTCILPPGNFIDQPVSVAVLGGSTVTTGSISYKSCPVGTEQSSTNITSCSPCALGFSNNQAGSPCAPCDLGKFADREGQSVCTNCYPGTYQNSPQQGACPSCPMGRYSIVPGQATCLPCDIGTFSAALGLQQCSPCPEGTFQDTSASTYCKVCPTGTYASGQGQQSCALCELGKSGNGTTPCQNCEEGRFQNVSGQSACIDCAPGSYCDQGQAVCAICELGKYGNGTVPCDRCPVGMFQNESGQSCIGCPAGTYSYSAGQAVCTVCEIGKYGDGTQPCELCPEGKYQDTSGQSFCLECPLGTYANSIGQAVCAVCEIGKYGNGSVPCDHCPEGQFQNTSGQSSCLGCPAGTYAGTIGQAVCALCELGKYGNGTSPCNPCPEGRFQDVSGQSLCLDCPEGSYATSVGQVVCALCELGKFGNGSFPCENCPEGKFQNTSGQLGCIDCPVGRYVNSAGQVVCLQCDIGKFALQQGQVVCDDCPAGTQQTEVGSTGCDLCSVGTFSAFPAQFQCKECPAGSYSNRSNQTACINCEIGRYQKVTASTVCSLCLVGSYSNFGGQVECRLCEVGRVNTVNGSDDCSTCAAGTYQVSLGESSCMLCDPGKFADTPSSCKVCSDNYISVAGGTCQACLPGMTSSVDHTRCLCPAGTYGLSDGQTCVSCSEGLDCSQAGLTLNETSTEHGWWRSSKFSATPIRCISMQDCPGSDKCGSARTGVLCSLCEPGYRSVYFGGPCLPCTTKSKSVGATVGIMLAVVAALVVIYVLILRQVRYLEKQLLDNASLKTVEMISVEGSALFIQGGTPTKHSKQSKQSKHQNSVLNRQVGMLNRQVNVVEQAVAAANPDSRSSNFISQCKMYIGFLQILLAVVSHGDLTWPSVFRKMLDSLAFLNFNFIPWQSVTCSIPMDGLTQAVVVCAVPILAILVAVPVPFVLRLVDKFDLSDTAENRMKRRISWHKLTRIVLFSCFLFYPYVSSVIVGVYNCRSVEGVQYMRNDASIICGSPTWRSRALPLIAALIIYPFGIPAFYFWTLYKHRHDLANLETQLALGSLYEPYSRDLWFFEILDMIFKLVMTSIVPFAKVSAQLQLGLGVIGFYVMMILVLDPYQRRIDHKLHSFLLTDLMVMEVFAITLQQEGQLTALADILLSVFLIMLVILMTLFFIATVLSTMKGTIYNWVRERRMGKRAGEGKSTELSPAGSIIRGWRNSAPPPPAPISAAAPSV